MGGGGREWETKNTLKGDCNHETGLAGQSVGGLGGMWLAKKTKWLNGASKSS